MPKAIRASLCAGVVLDPQINRAMKSLAANQAINYNLFRRWASDDRLLRARKSPGAQSGDLHFGTTPSAAANLYTRTTAQKQRLHKGGR